MLYAYYTKTRNEPEYDQVEQRYKLHYIHKLAKTSDIQFDIEEYNKTNTVAKGQSTASAFAGSPGLELPIRQEKQINT